MFLFFSFLLTFSFYHYRNQLLCRVSKTFGKTCKTLGKESSANCTSATASLLSTFYRALDKDFTECRHVLGKEKLPSRRPITATEPLPSVLGDTQQIVSLFAECSPD
jgi:hypothetical protein